MKNKKKDVIKDCIEEELQEAISQMENYDAGSDEYYNAAKSISELMKSINTREDGKWYHNGTLLVVGGNILGVIMILTFEKANVITSKAFNYLIKGRV